MLIPRLPLILLFFWFCTTATCASGQSTTDSLLNQLDKVISERESYLRAKRARLAELEQTLHTVSSATERFDILGDLFTEYLSFNADSAYLISLRQEILADSISDRNRGLNAMLNKANTLSATGMYHETLQLLDSIDSHAIPDYLKPYYFHTKRTVYGYLADYAAFKPEKKYYEILTDQYRDSLLMVNPPNSFFHTLIKADQMNVHGHPREAIDLLENFITDNDLTEHDRAILAWSLAESYEKINDTENQKKQLLISAIADMKSSVREYISLRQLALLLYQEGDLDRAYKFMSIAMDDAAECNARQRIIELSRSYPMINGIYVETVRSQKKTLERTIIIITLLSIILILLLMYMRKQMRRISEERQKVEEANSRLNELNAQLIQSNKDLSEANRAISEISELKEVYIGRYMEQSLAYIEMLDGYRKSIGKLVSTGKIADLTKLVKSSSIFDDELKSFYEQFDRTFLSLFPTFVEDFNNLLLPGEAIIPKKTGLLNTELRIFALIRLGISDSDKIARFLRYSLTTIYNYRTKVRNKAKGDRNQLENLVAKIGQQSSRQ